MPLRTLLILIALAVVILAARRLFFSPRPKTKPRLEQDKMVQCAHCGIYVPEPEALSRDGRYYCSPSHLEEDKDPSQK